MPEYPPLANPDVMAWVGERSYALGLGYARGHAISHSRRMGLTLAAQCQGTRPEPYRVTVALDTHGIASGECSCPVGAGGHCKHVAALLLTWIATPEDFSEREPLDRALERLSKEDLVDLLLRLARRSPEVEGLLELSLPAPIAANDAGNESTNQAADAETVRDEASEEVNRALRQGERGMASAEEARARIRRLLDGADAAVERGDVPRAAAIYQATIEAITAFEDALGNGEFDEDEDDYYERGRYGRYDDDYYDEEVDPALLLMASECVDECVEGLRRCLSALSASDERASRRAILEALFMLYRWGIGSGVTDVTETHAAMGSDVPSVILEQATPAERHHLAALAQEAMPSPSHDAYDDGESEWGVGGVRRKLARFWLELERETLDEESYLRFCRETELTGYLVERLLELGRVEEAATEATRGADVRLLPLAERFIRHGQGDLFAEIVRERARTSVQDYQLLVWLKRYAQEVGRTEEALGYALTLFWQRPTTEGYEELRALAGPLGRWDTLRTETLVKLADTNHYTTLTQIHLLEQDVDQALQTVRRVRSDVWGAYDANDLHIQVARAAETSHPGDAIQLYTEAANGLIARQGRANYAVAAQHLARVRIIYRQQGRGMEWQALITDLRSQQKRLRALQDELKQAGLFDPEPGPPRPPAGGVDRGAGADKQQRGPTVHLLRADGTA